MPSLSDNGADGVIAQFGEMSTTVKTFTRDMKNYANPVKYPGVELITTKSINDNGGSMTPPPDIQDTLLALGNWIFNQYTAGTIPTNINKGLFIQSIKDELPQLDNIVIHEIILGNTAGKNMPDNISFTMLYNTTEYSCKFWFSDSRMRTQYDDYQIFIIPPIANIEELNGSVSTVRNLLDNVTPGDIIRRSQDIQSKFPATNTTVLTLTWHDQNNPAVTLKTDWYAVVYGQAGLDLDALKNAVRDEINRTSSETKWNIIYPELYSENEFVVVPMWDNIAQPENAASADAYASYARFGELSDTLSARLPVGYGQMTTLSTFIAQNAYIFSAQYRTVMALIIGNPSNAGNVYNIEQQYKDYRNLNTDSPDFIRMEPTTREWAVKINDALEIARTLLPSDAAPTGYTKLQRGSRLFLTFEMHGFYYLVLTKYSYNL
jgi:hypothetical protein